MNTMPLALLGLLVAGAAQAQAQGDIKPGLWETRILKLEQDGKDMTAEMNALMASLPGGGRSCISQEMAGEPSDDGPFPVPPPHPESNCEQPKINRSGKRKTIEVTCRDWSYKSETVMELNQVTAKEEMVMSAKDGVRHTMISEAQINFIGSDCGDIEPADKVLQRMMEEDAAQDRRMNP